jgi:AcrR family transcriptional regulator
MINTEHKWIEAGYEQFAMDGLEGIQVERLAKIIGLNKSGYYHYFGDRETFLEKLMDRHLQYGQSFANELKQVKHFDPEYISILIKYSTQLMFTNQLIKYRHEKLFEDTQRLVLEMVDPVLVRLYADFIGFTDYLEFSTKYFNQVRYMFHGQITPDRMNYPFLRDFLYKSREVIQQAVAIASKTNS